MSGTVLVRAIAAGDWDAVTALEREAYRGLGLCEGREALQSRAAASPDTCFVLEADGQAAGYLIALPYPAGDYPDLRRPEQAAARPGTAVLAGNLHLHDVVVAGTHRRRGLGGLLLDRLAETATARGHRWLSLVSVGGSAPFWRARGFTAHPGPVTGYGATAVYMSRPLPARIPARPVTRRPHPLPQPEVS